MKQPKQFSKEKDVSFTTQIQSLSHDGRGVAIIDNKKAFILNALPHEIVTYKSIKKRNKYHEAMTLQILSPSPERVIPPCLHYSICGGCSLQHMNIQAQLTLKQNTLLEQLKHFGEVSPESILSPLHTESLGYRRKARLGVKFVFKKNKLLMGFHEKTSPYLADLDQCLILHPQINQHFQALKELIATLQISLSIPQVEVAMGDHEVAFLFRHTKPLPDNDKMKLVDFAKSQGFQLYLQPNPPESIQKCWPDDKNETLSYTLPDYHLELMFHPLDFTQINLEINRLMVNQAIKMLDLKAQDTVLDLFCGIGNFTLPIAKFAGKVVGIEGNDAMVIRAIENAKHNNIANAEFYAANLMKATDKDVWLTSRYDKILLDPPRGGAKEILSFIPLWDAKKIVYVSCNPATLARDSGELVKQYGYQLKQTGVMNMFPHTSHIEAMAVFEKN